MKFVEEGMLRVRRVCQRRQIRTQDVDLRIRQQPNACQIAVLMEERYAVGRKGVARPI